MKLKDPFPRGRIAFFVTSNVHKFMEARPVLAEYRIATALLRFKTLEIQDDNIENIAKTSAREASEKCDLPVFVEDAGLFIEALNGFPGPYSHYVYQTIGTRGILRLMRNVDQRDARFRSVVAFCDTDRSMKIFNGEVAGKIAEEERGSFGFGFDPVFEPLEVPGKTFAEITLMEKGKYSHRAKALRKFAGWYASAFQRRFK